MANLWPGGLAIVITLFLIVLEIAVFGYFPGLSDPDVLLTVCWSCLGAAWVLMLFTFMSGLACDIENTSEVKNASMQPSGYQTT